jgi:uncharacterized protein (DUF2141 family)
MIRRNRLLLLALAACLPVPGNLAAAPGAIDRPAVLKVHVEGLRNRRGDLRLGVFDSAAGFPRERGSAMFWRSIGAAADEKTFEVELPPGRYAIVVLHDENSNKKLDTNFIGVPREGHGVSNNPKPKRRAATYREAAFDLDRNGAEVTVSMQYNYL